MTSSAVPVVELALEAPPDVVQIGSAVHGAIRSHEHFALPDLWQAHLYLYESRVSVGTFDGPLTAGDVSIWPPDTVIDQEYVGPSRHFYVHFRPQPGRTRRIPIVQHAGRDAVPISELWSDALAASPSDRARVSANVWTALCRVAGLGSTHHDVPAVVSTALAHIEAGLDQPVRVPDIARLVGVSHNHLTRLFVQVTGKTVVGYIRSRRMARARHLLVASTLPISSIASSVGVPDLQAFNRACHIELGASPRAVRAGGGFADSEDRLPLWDLSADRIDRPRHFSFSALTGEEIFLDTPIAGMELNLEKAVPSRAKHDAIADPPESQDR